MKNSSALLCHCTIMINQFIYQIKSFFLVCSDKHYVIMVNCEVQ